MSNKQTINQLAQLSNTKKLILKMKNKSVNNKYK